ncbi:MAG: penicillin acylase family protein, partial [Candidatus Hydrogenedentota bacterium]
MITKFWLVLTIAAIPVCAQMDDDPLSLWGRATLYRDEWGVPHIQADDLRAMAFAFGYAQAEDHAEKMLMAYRIVSGSAAELMGETYASSDEFALQMAHSDLAQAAYSGADDVTRDLCEGFALGVNSWLFEQGEGAPRGADGVSPADPLALLHAFL